MQIKKAYRVKMVTEQEAMAGVVKDSIVYFYGNAPENAFFFTLSPYEEEEGIALFMHQVERAKEYDVDLEKSLNAAPEVPTDDHQATSGGMKFDTGKVQMSLLLIGAPFALRQVAEVLTFGAEKYEAHSWRSVPDGERRYTEAMLRHVFKYLEGERLDEESGLSHLAHAATNLMFLMELAKKEEQ